MKELIGKIQELVSSAEAKNKELTGLLEKAKATEAFNAAETARLEGMRANLRDREAAVSKVEDVVKLKQEAVALRGKAEQGMEDLKKERDAFNLKADERMRTLDTQERSINAEAADLKVRNKILTDGLKKLEEDKAKVKDAMNKLGIK